jgi:hypothetical protein
MAAAGASLFSFCIASFISNGTALPVSMGIKHVHQHDPNMMKIIGGVETVDHPSDGALVA